MFLQQWGQTGGGDSDVVAESLRPLFDRTVLFSEPVDKSMKKLSMHLWAHEKNVLNRNL